MRAAPASVSKPIEGDAPRQTLPLHPVKPIRSSKPTERDQPNFASKDDKPSHRRQIQVVKSNPAPVHDAPPERTQPTPQLRGPTPEEVMEDPLVRSVLDVFEGEIKRVHPKNK